MASSILPILPEEAAPVNAPFSYPKNSDSISSDGIAEQFTGMEGKYVPLKETIRGFKEIIEGKHDDLPESAFLFVGTIEEAIEKAKKQ